MLLGAATVAGALRVRHNARRRHAGSIFGSDPAAQDRLFKSGIYFGIAIGAWLVALVWSLSSPRHAFDWSMIVCLELAVAIVFWMRYQAHD